MPPFPKIVLLVFLALVLSGCGLLRSGIASLRSTSDFHRLQTDSRVLAEPGAEDLANQVAGFLPVAIRTIEKEQLRSFAKPVEVFVCASEDSFARHTGASRKARGAVTTRLFLSGALKNEPAEMTRARLTHELSHLHFVQQLGVYRFNAHIPAWFQEGLATLVSDGGGAEKVSEADAAKAVLDKRYFTPEAQGSFWFPRSGSSYGLEPHMFYRQASMFVGYLKCLSEVRFGLFLLAIEDGEDFDGSFRSHYGLSIDEAWEEFVAQLRDKQRGIRFAVASSR